MFERVFFLFRILPGFLIFFPATPDAALDPSAPARARLSRPQGLPTQKQFCLAGSGNAIVDGSSCCSVALFVTAVWGARLSPSVEEAR